METENMCPYCNEAGEDSYENPCLICNGFGYLPKDYKLDDESLAITH